MKIAILTSGILPVPAVQGGAVENLIDFYLEFNEQHQLHDITVFSVAHPDTKNHKALQSKVNHYHYIDTSSRKARFMRKIREWIQPKGDYYNNHIEYYFERAYRQLRRQHYDCIILENRPGYAKKLAARGQKGIVLHLHNDLLNSNVPYHEILKDSFSGILTVSDYIRNQVSTLVALDKITTVHNGINLHHFSPKSQSSIHRTDLGFKADDFILVYSGRINKDKGISELIDAMQLLQDEPHIKLLVIGSTFFGNATNDNSFVRSLKEKAKSISQRIIFTGFVDYHRMPDYLRLADVAVVPSVWDDPFPTTILEAQAMGLPIICSNRGGIPEEVGTDNAIIVPTGEQYVNGLAEAIRSLYRSPEQRATMSEASLRRAPYFDKERFADDFFKALGSIPF